MTNMTEAPCLPSENPSEQLREFIRTHNIGPVGISALYDNVALYMAEQNLQDARLVSGNELARTQAIAQHAAVSETIRARSTDPVTGIEYEDTLILFEESPIQDHYYSWALGETFLDPITDEEREKSTTTATMRVTGILYAAVISDLDAVRREVHEQSR